MCFYCVFFQACLQKKYHTPVSVMCQIMCTDIMYPGVKLWKRGANKEERGVVGREVGGFKRKADTKARENREIQTCIE